MRLNSVSGGPSLQMHKNLILCVPGWHLYGINMGALSRAVIKIAAKSTYSAKHPSTFLI